MAGGARGRGKHPLTRCDLPIWGVRCTLLLRTQPLVEGSLFFGDNKERHVSMLQTTEFRALAAINAGTLGPDGNLVAAARNQILFAGEARYPERMDDIGALKQKSHID